MGCLPRHQQLAVSATDWPQRAAEIEELRRELTAAHRQYGEVSRGQPHRADPIAARLREVLDASYEPVLAAMHDLKAGSASSVVVLLDFLLADPWCFRSGCVKADAMHALANRSQLLTAVRRRAAHEVIRHRLRHREPRLLRHTARLAMAVWDDSLEDRVRGLAAAGGEPGTDALYVLESRAVE